MKKIAIIDDVLLNARLIQAIVKRIGDVDTETFIDPVAALSWCRANEPDLILLDYQMPGMNGIEFVQSFRIGERFTDTPIVVITGEDRKDVLSEALIAGATDFLRKPVDEVELLARARNMLRLRDRQLQLAAANEKLAILAITDELTGLLNRRQLMKGFGDEFARMLRYRHPLAVAMVDVDHFKRVNDNYGHALGDNVLKTLAQVMKHEMRDVDFAGRLGGEEFAVVFPNTDIVGAALACERLRQVVEGTAVEADDGNVFVTVSIGVTQMIPDCDTPEGLLKRADDLLHKAKSAGRNRVETDLAGSGGGEAEPGGAPDRSAVAADASR